MMSLKFYCSRLLTALVLLCTAPWLSAQTFDFAQVVEKVDPAVVNIRTTERIDPKLKQSIPDFFAFPFNIPGFPAPKKAPQKPAPSPEGEGGRGEESARGIGSGFVISADGYILTNHHVVNGADDIYVTFLDKRELKAKVIGSDARTDVALLKVDALNLSKLSIGNPDALRKGEWVLAIGSPFGLESTVTAGIVSAKGRDTGDFVPFIQTDVSINPGNSGGPLLNSRGEVIGINSQIFSRSGGSEGISFAIPIDEAMRVVEQLKATGSVARGKIGVAIADVTKELAEGLGFGKLRGALVNGVERAGPANKAGIEAGDIILKFDGVAIEKSIDLPRLAGTKKPGTPVVLSVWQQGNIKEVKLVLGEFASPKSSLSAQAKPDAKETVKPNALGVTTSDLTDSEKRELQLRSGVKVETVQGVAASVGLRAGDFLLALAQGSSQMGLSSSAQFAQVLGRADAAKPLFLLVKRGDDVRWIAVRINAP